MTPEDEKHLRSLLRHIEGVRQSCLLLGERLIELGEDRIGIDLISNSQIHDLSKFKGSEWLYLRTESLGDNKNDRLEQSRNQHVKTNPHHPEYWGSIHEMPRVYLAEMVCDWSARSHEFGNDLREWIKDKATKKFDMKVQSKTYKQIKEFVDILLDPKLK
jgi:hypothetical protein